MTLIRSICTTKALDYIKWQCRGNRVIINKTCFTDSWLNPCVTLRGQELLNVCVCVCVFVV